MKLEEAKNLQNVLKLNLNEISKWRFKLEEQKLHQKILNRFADQEKMLLNFLMTLNTNQFMKKRSTY